jgi:hypothetical protein
MIEVLFLVSAVWALSTRARQRNVNRTPFVIGALLGWFAIWIADCVMHWNTTAPGKVPPPARFVDYVPLYLRWLLVGGLFVAVELKRPDRVLEPWECPDCGELNEYSALSCHCRRLRPDLRA